MTKRFPHGVLLALLAACGTVGSGDDENGPVGGKADDLGGGATPSIYAVGNRLHPWAGQDEFFDQVQPVLARQCVTCHGCGDAPCQLKLSSYEGVLRGSNEDDLYGTRVLGIDKAYDPMHLAYGRVLDSEGAVNYEATAKQWRKHDFYPILNREEDSVLARVLTEAHERTSSFDQSFELKENLDSRSFTCLQSDDPKGKELVGRAMPLGLPALAENHSEAVVDWLAAGAKGPSVEAQLGAAAPAHPEVIQAWEKFFNTEMADARGQLVGRYLYEHLFFAHLHFSGSSGEFYRMVRSRTPTGPIDEIVTERIFETPRDKVYYRFQKLTEVLVAKSHVVWEIGPDTMERWRELFLESEDWTVNSEVPDYDPKSDNPFAYFAPIPAHIRYRFMIEHSRHLVDAMVRGSVCTGSGATFAIRDRFWVWFLDPDSDVASLDMVGDEFTHGPLLGESSWFHLNPESANPVREVDYLRAYRRQLQTHRPNGLAVSDLWDGDGGSNPNAWLTVLRHDKSATVHHGPINGQPETIWVLSYSNYERLYYNLVVQFKAWSHAAHKLETWALMSFIRSEAEDLFATMLPPATREELRVHPTRGWGVISRTLFPFFGDCSSEREDAIEGDCEYPTAVEFPDFGSLGANERIEQSMRYLSDLVRDHIGGDVTEVDPMDVMADGKIPQAVTSREELEAAFDGLTGWTNEAWQYLPELTLVRVRSGKESWLYTIVANRMYKAHERVYQNSTARVPAGDTLSVNRGVIGHYPGLFVDLPLEDAVAFIAAVRSVGSRADWAKIVKAENVGKGGLIISRQRPEFWTFLDEVHQQWFAEDRVEAAVLDVSEYLWPQSL